MASAHDGPQRTEWVIDTTRITDDVLAQFVVRCNERARRALADLKSTATATKHDTDDDGGTLYDYAGIVDTDTDDDDSVPPWLATGLIDGRTKIGRVLQRRKLPTAIALAVQELALVSKQVQYLRAGQFVVVATSEPSAFMRLGHLSVDDEACFRVGGCHETAPLILGTSYGSVVFYIKRADDRGHVLYRSWGKHDARGLYWTNGYSDHAPGGRDTFSVLLALVGCRLADDEHAKPRGSYHDDETDLMYSNSDGLAVGRVARLSCENSEYSHRCHCDDCGTGIHDDETYSACDMTLCENCYSENYTYIERYGDSVHNDNVVRLHDGEYDTDDHVTLLHDGRYASDDDDELCELHDGEFALWSDDDVVTLADDEYALTSDVTELHDGSYVVTADTELHELSDGEWALASDSTLCHDGEYWLSDDVQRLHVRYARRAGRATCSTIFVADDGHVYGHDDDVTELHDGSYVLADDDDVVATDDGEWALASDTIVADDGTVTCCRLWSDVVPTMAT